MTKTYKLSILIVTLVIGLSPIAYAGPTFTFNPVLDYGTNNGSQTDPTWGWICEIGSYQTWFGFDVSTIPDSAPILSASFTAYMMDSGTPASQRSLWYEPDDSWIATNTNPTNKLLTEMVGTATHSGSWTWITFNIDLSKHDWTNDLIDNYISLMLTGPLSGAHECGQVRFTESGYLPVLSITIPEPGTVLLVGLGGLAALRKRRA